MEKDKIITFRVPIELAEKMKASAEILDISVGEFIKNRIDYFYNPPPTPQPETIEIIKEVFIDSEGTVKGKMIELSDNTFAELNKLKYNPEQSMDAFVSDILWNRIHWSQKKRSSPTTQINGTSQNPTAKNTANVGGESSFGVFEDYKRRKREDCFTDEDWKELRGEIESDTRLTEKQKRVIIQYN